jgi:uncharacterized flavoprotein (TIGR03862 family)
MHNVCIIGGGPAGLMAAEVIAASGARVDLYDSLPSVGRKFLMAGRGGLNLTHTEPRQQFVRRYGTRQQQVEPWLAAFGPEALRAWVHALGVETFTGSSGRVFPREMKASPLLRAWLLRLRECGVAIHMRHRWLGWHEDGKLKFSTPGGHVHVRPDATLLALGGGSWARLGSDGAWVALLGARGVPIAPLMPANCGFDCAWSDHFRTRYAGRPLKSIVASFSDGQGKIHRQAGECIITASGIEGGVIYALSAPMRDAIVAHGIATLHLDLAPGRTLQRLTVDLATSRGKRSLSNHLQNKAGISGVKAGLLREFASAAELADPLQLAARIKSVPLQLNAPRPLDEAISSAGGVAFDALDDRLMLHQVPGVFCAGEMLDWEAPTGGYLLTGCFASGRVAGAGVVEWLRTAQ